MDPQNVYGDGRHARKVSRACDTLFAREARAHHRFHLILLRRIFATFRPESTTWRPDPELHVETRLDLTDEEAVMLLDLYFDVCVATYSIVHRQTVDGWLTTVQRNVSENREHTEDLGMANAAVLFSLFAIATLFRQKARGHSGDEESVVQSDSLFRKAVELTSAETGVARLESVQARTLQVFYLLMTCRMTRAWYTFGICLQMISALGMHRRKSKTHGHGRISDYIHSQCRKRAFWTVYILDRIPGVVFGRPPHFNDEDIDQDLPDRVNDEDMDADGPKAGFGSNDCHLDTFVFNARLGRMLGDISQTI